MTSEPEVHYVDRDDQPYIHIAHWEFADGMEEGGYARAVAPNILLVCRGCGQGRFSKQPDSVDGLDP